MPSFIEYICLRPSSTTSSVQFAFVALSPPPSSAKNTTVHYAWLSTVGAVGAGAKPPIAAGGAVVETGAAVTPAASTPPGAGLGPTCSLGPEVAAPRISAAGTPPAPVVLGLVSFDAGETFSASPSSPPSSAVLGGTVAANWERAGEGGRRGGGTLSQSTMRYTFVQRHSAINTQAETLHVLSRRHSALQMYK